MFGTNVGICLNCAVFILGSINIDPKVEVATAQKTNRNVGFICGRENVENMKKKKHTQWEREWEWERWKENAKKNCCHIKEHLKAGKSVCCVACVKTAKKNGICNNTHVRKIYWIFLFLHVHIFIPDSLMSYLSRKYNLYKCIDTVFISVCIKWALRA